MEAELIAGIDIGTGSIKAVVLDKMGTVVMKFQEHYPGNGNTFEQNVEDVFDSFKTCFKTIVSSIPGRITTVCLSSAMHSILAVDSSGQPLMKAILWSDRRSNEIAQSLRESTLGEQIYKATGTPIHSMSPLCKLRWLREHERSLFDRAHKFISIKEYIWYRLFGEYVIDHSIASATGLLNIISLDWNEESLKFASLSSEKLSKPAPSSYSNSINDFFGLSLKQNIKFLIGGSDGCFANLGSLCLSPGEAAITIGTSGAARITSPKPVLDYPSMNFCYILDKDLFVCGGPTNNGGSIIEWLVNDFSGGQYSYDQVLSSLDDTPEGAEGLLFLPYLNGERAPVWDEKSQGVFFGVKAIHKQAHFFRAAVEGLCYGLKQILDSIQKKSGSINSIRVSGGISSSKEVLQILADITGKEVSVDKRGDASAIGAAYFCLKTIGWIGDYEDLSNSYSEGLKPKKEHEYLYKKYFTIYEMLYPALKDVMHADGNSYTWP